MTMNNAVCGYCHGTGYVLLPEECPACGKTNYSSTSSIKKNVSICFHCGQRLYAIKVQCPACGSSRI